MRITNKMMNNNMMANINRNKYSMSIFEEQYSSGKKIQKPSQDPIIAVRALKLRTNLSEVKQYLEKNIPDAESWMEMTQGAIITINDALKEINTLCVQGGSDPLSPNDRRAIALNLQEMKEQIYQEGNTNFAGRYVFTGYKTDSSLTFENDTKDLSYEIKEKFKGTDIRGISKVIDGYDLDDIDGDLTKPPKLIESHVLKLSYGKLDDQEMGDIRYTDETGEHLLPVNWISKNNPDYDPDIAPYKDPYSPGPGEVNFIPETGELIFGDDVYKDVKNADSIDVTYSKSNFSKGELKPENYFDCRVTTPDDPVGIEYTKTKQDIQYEVSFNQRLKINLEGSDAINHSIGRVIDDILERVNEVVEVEDKIAEVKKRLNESSLSPEDREKNEDLLEQLETELVLRKEVMGNAFQNGIGSSDREQNTVNAALADLGSRMVRLNLTESRLLSQKEEFTELMSTNEDISQLEAYVRFNSAQNIYMASLAATAKVMQNSLLDFI